MFTCVINDVDKCPDTQIGTKVNAIGCKLGVNLIGVNFKANFVRHAQVYGQFVLDEFKFSNVHFVLNRYQYNPNIISEMIQIAKKFMTKPVKKSLI